MVDDWAMVENNKDEDYSSFSVVFPPINHENLNLNHFSSNQNQNYNHIPQSQSQSQSQSDSQSPLSTSEYDIWGDEEENSSSSSSSSSSAQPLLSSSAPFDSQVRKGLHFTGWLSIGLNVLRSKLHSAASSFRKPSHSLRRGSIWSFGIRATTFVIFVMMFMRWKKKKKKKNRQRNLIPNETRLTNIIKEKDRKIAQLLNQIAQMNEILIDRHKALAAKVVK